MKVDRFELSLWLLCHGAAAVLGWVIGRGLLDFIDTIRAAF